MEVKVSADKQTVSYYFPNSKEAKAGVIVGIDGGTPRISFISFVEGDNSDSMDLTFEQAIAKAAQYV